MARFVHILFATLLLAFSSPAALEAREPFTLDAVREQVQRDYAAVAQMPADTLRDRLKAGDVLLLDVREWDEYAVSHISGAERVDPGTWKSTFLKGFKDKARGKTVVFYCSVGVRSSQLAEKVQVALMSAGAKAVYNLDGGVFGWHNEKRPLVDAKGATDFVHPYDSYWGTLVDRQELTKTKP